MFNRKRIKKLENQVRVLDHSVLELVTLLSETRRDFTLLVRHLGLDIVTLKEHRVVRKWDKHAPPYKPDPLRQRQDPAVDF